MIQWIKLYIQEGYYVKHRFPKLFSVVLSLVMVILLFPDVSVKTSAAYENTHTNTGNQREDIVAVAETPIGYHEGANNDTKYNCGNGTISGYPVDGCGYSWCQCFVKNKESFTETQFQTADLNQDGKVNIYDFLLLKKMLLQK